MIAAEDLTAAERQVWDAFPTGQVVNFSAGNAGADDPAQSHNWGSDRQIRAEVLSALLCDVVPIESGHIGRVSIRGARVIGMIDLREATVKNSLHLDKCAIEDGIDLSDARVRSIRLAYCRLGRVVVQEATIDGQFILIGAHLDGGDGSALKGEGLTVTGNMDCRWGFSALGEIRLLNATIKGQLSLSGAQLDGK
ncbi:MAG TPA: hypothetical protein VMU94_10745, partial [Streptosporangiaceae bacterium]|nr:hypothetical protein [Streptosporangiaceae bacterium]